MDVRLILLAGGCAVITYSLCQIFRLVAQAFRIVDQQGSHAPDEHAPPTGAGFSFALAISLVILFLSTRVETTFNLGFLFPLMLVACAGLWNDLKPLAWFYRVPMYLFAVAWVVELTALQFINGAAADTLHHYAILVIATVAVCCFVYLFDAMDGFDGAAISETVFVLCAVVGLIILKADLVPWRMVVMLGCCVGFLIINWPRGRVLMGSAGSSFLGLLFGYLALYELGINFWAWMTLLAWVISDGGLSIIWRSVHKEHHGLLAYQQLQVLIGKKLTLLLLLAVNCLWLLPWAYFADQDADFGLTAFSAAVLPLLVLQYFIGAGEQVPRLAVLRGRVER